MLIMILQTLPVKMINHCEHDFKKSQPTSFFVGTYLVDSTHNKCVGGGVHPHGDFIFPLLLFLINLVMLSTCYSYLVTNLFLGAAQWNTIKLQHSPVFPLNQSCLQKRYWDPDILLQRGQWLHHLLFSILWSAPDYVPKMYLHMIVVCHCENKNK